MAVVVVGMLTPPPARRRTGQQQERDQRRAAVAVLLLGVLAAMPGAVWAAERQDDRWPQSEPSTFRDTHELGGSPDRTSKRWASSILNFFFGVPGHESSVGRRSSCGSAPLVAPNEPAGPAAERHADGTVARAWTPGSMSGGIAPPTDLLTTDNTCRCGWVAAACDRARVPWVIVDPASTLA
jgi:hypothetical protein